MKCHQPQTSTLARDKITRTPTPSPRQSHAVFGVKINVHIVITGWAYSFQKLVLHSLPLTALMTTQPRLLYFVRGPPAMDQPGVWENTTMSLKLGVMMWDVACSERGFIPCNVHMFWRFSGVALDGQTHGAPTTTAVGWCKHPVRRARANRELHFERNNFNFDCDRDRRHWESLANIDRILIESSQDTFIFIFITLPKEGKSSSFYGQRDIFLQVNAQYINAVQNNIKTHFVQKM